MEEQRTEEERLRAEHADALRGMERAYQVGALACLSSSWPWLLDDCDAGAVGADQGSSLRASLCTALLQAEHARLLNMHAAELRARRECLDALNNVSAMIELQGER